MGRKALLLGYDSYLLWHLLEPWQLGLCSWISLTFAAKLCLKTLMLLPFVCSNQAADDIEVSDVILSHNCDEEMPGKSG